MSQQINEKIGAYILESGSSREELADKIGITRPTLRSRLNGETDWRWGEVIKIAEITNSTMNELAGI